MKQGWKGESRRHSLARKGIKTAKPRMTSGIHKDAINKEHYLNELIVEHSDLIAKALRLTRETNKEHGFSICRDEKNKSYPMVWKNTTDEGMCVGENCSVQMPHCKSSDGSDYAIEFHTHPDGTIAGYFSGQDIRDALMHKPDFMIMGVNRLDSFMINKFPNDARIKRDKNKATIVCWQLIKDKDGKYIAWDEIDEFEDHWIYRQNQLNNWLPTLMKRVRNGESNLFRETQYTIDIKTGRTEYKEGVK